MDVLNFPNKHLDQRSNFSAKLMRQHDLSEISLHLHKSHIKRKLFDRMNLRYLPQWTLWWHEPTMFLLRSQQHSLSLLRSWQFGYQNNNWKRRMSSMQQTCNPATKVHTQKNRQWKQKINKNVCLPLLLGLLWPPDWTTKTPAWFVLLECHSAFIVIARFRPISTKLYDNLWQYWGDFSS